MRFFNVNTGTPQQQTNGLEKAGPLCLFLSAKSFGQSLDIAKEYPRKSIAESVPFFGRADVEESFPPERTTVRLVRAVHAGVGDRATLYNTGR